MAKKVFCKKCHKLATLLPDGIKAKKITVICPDGHKVEVSG